MNDKVHADRIIIHGCLKFTLLVSTKVASNGTIKLPTQGKSNHLCNF